jgi:hypothetical protein
MQVFEVLASRDRDGRVVVRVLGNHALVVLRVPGRSLGDRADLGLRQGIDGDEGTLLHWFAAILAGPPAVTRLDAYRV